MIKLYIHYKITDGPWGGANHFFRALKNLLNEFKKDQVEIVTDINEKYDIFLMNSGYAGPSEFLDIQVVKNIKKYGYTKLTKRLFRKNQNKKVVHRLDGLRAIYNNQWDKMDELQLRACRFADHLIFQSKHCLESFERYGYDGDNYSIVYNGVNSSIFNTQGKEFWNGTEKLKLFSCNWSSNPRKGYHTIARFSELKGVESYFVGNWPKDINKRNVICLPPMKQEELAYYYRKCDAFLHPARDDPCPNVVLEALSCGLPIIYHDSGGTPEIAGNYGLPLPSDLTTDTMIDLIDTMKEKYPHFVENIKKDVRKFSIERAVEDYINVFSTILMGDKK